MATTSSLGQVATALGRRRRRRHGGGAVDLRRGVVDRCQRRDVVDGRQPRPPPSRRRRRRATTESSAPAASEPQTASSEEFAATLAATCEGDAGHPLLAAALRNAALPDGSLRVVTVLQTCDVEFIGAVDAELGRPLTNVEELIADPVNNVTPNQAQRDVLNAELAVYWRLAEAWAQAQAGAGAPTETEATADTAPTSVDEPATTAAELHRVPGHARPLLTARSLRSLARIGGRHRPSPRRSGTECHLRRGPL